MKNALLRGPMPAPQGAAQEAAPGGPTRRYAVTGATAAGSE